MQSEQVVAENTEETPLLTAAEQTAASASFGGVWPLIRELIEAAVLAAITVVLLNFVTARYMVEGSSMEPNLHTGQFLIVNRLPQHLGAIERGDVIVFRFPGNPEENYVKRVIGLPGDEIVIENGVVSVNNEQLEEPYLGPSGQTYYGSRYSVVVPPGSYFVLGDNRTGSSDSRNWGMLDHNLVIGRAWVSYWPPEDWGVVEHYHHQGMP